MWFLKFQIILKIIPHTKHFRSWLPFCQSSMRTMVETQDSRRTQFVRMTGICKSLALFLLIYHCISDDIIFIFFTKDSTRILWTTPTGPPRPGRSIESSLLTRGGGRWSSPSLWYCQIAYCLHADSFFRYFGTKLSSRDSTMAPSCAPSSTLTIRWFCFSVHVLNSQLKTTAILRKLMQVDQKMIFYSAHVLNVIPSWRRRRLWENTCKLTIRWFFYSPPVLNVIPSWRRQRLWENTC